ncbi:hypothetical protein [Leptolyngbya subtilissima]
MTCHQGCLTAWLLFPDRSDSTSQRSNRLRYVADGLTRLTIYGIPTG